MIRGGVRGSLALLVVVLLSVALTGCLPNRPGAAVDWLKGQAGVASTEVLYADNGEFQSSGTVRGELDPKLDDAGLAKLVAAVRDYLSSHDQVGIRLGRDGVDFWVYTDSGVTEQSIPIWKSVSDVDGVASGVVAGTSIHVRTLRTDAFGVLAFLEGVGTELRLEAMADQRAIAADTKEDSSSDDSHFAIDTVSLEWKSGCTPTDQERALAESFFTSNVLGAYLTLCSGFDLYYGSDTSLATAVPDLYDQLAAADLLDFPVSAHQAVGQFNDGHLVAVTPGDPAAFALLPAFEVPGTPTVNYTLAADRSLDVTEYGTPTATLLGIVSASPVAASLPSIRIEGDTSAISGTLAQLTDMLTQVTALVATSDIFTNVELGPTTGSLALSSGVGEDPDVVAAAQALRASGAWSGRTFAVTYISMQVNIVDGVATLGDPNYTDPHVVQGFVDAWNATAG